MGKSGGAVLNISTIFDLQINTGNSETFGFKFWIQGKSSLYTVIKCFFRWAETSWQHKEIPVDSALKGWDFIS